MWPISNIHVQVVTGNLVAKDLRLSFAQRQPRTCTCSIGCKRAALKKCTRERGKKRKGEGVVYHAQEGG